MRSLSLWHQSPESSVILEQNLPEDSQGQLLIESLYSQVSLGTEKMVAMGHVPPGVYESMKVPYMDGSFSFPCKYGYSLVGRVLSDAGNLKGRIVHLMHPHQDLEWVNPSSVFPVPDDIPPIRAALASNLETAVNALWDSEISVGDTILIAGFGLIGALIAGLAAGIPGVKVFIYEKIQYRSRLASELGYNIIMDSEQVLHSFDAAFNTSGNETALQFCIDHVGYEGQVTEVSFYGAKQVQVSLGASFHTERKRIAASQVSHIPLKKINRWDHLRRKALVFKLLENKEYDSLAGLIIPFRDSPGFFTRIRQGEINEISVLFQYK